MKFLWALFFFAAAGMAASAGTLAQFRTAFGDIEVELYDQDKPLTVSNFVQYVTSGKYRDAFIHRCVTNFVIQGGGYYVSDHNPTNVTVSAIQTYPPIPNETGVGRRFNNVYGTIAMAKLSGNTNSATSQWFFNLADNLFLDAPDANNHFTVFGHVVRGTNVLNQFHRFRPYVRNVDATNVVVNFGGVFAEFPMLRSPVIISNVAYVADASIVYTDISLLNVSIAENGQGREIAWQSVTDKTNVVEFTQGFPPQWQTLTTTNGNGGRISVRDDDSNSVHRFYRVRVDY